MKTILILDRNQSSYSSLDLKGVLERETRYTITAVAEVPETTASRIIGSIIDSDENGSIDLFPKDQQS